MLKDKVGRMLVDTVDKGGMVLLNTMDNLCTGGPTRIQVRVDGTQESTVDYVMCSRALCPYIQCMRIDDG